MKPHYPILHCLVQPHYLILHFLMQPHYQIPHCLNPLHFSLPCRTSHMSKLLEDAMDKCVLFHHPLSTYECLRNGILLVYAYDWHILLDHSHIVLGLRSGCFWPLPEIHPTCNHSFRVGSPPSTLTFCCCQLRIILLVSGHKRQVYRFFPLYSLRLLACERHT